MKKFFQLLAVLVFSSVAFAAPYRILEYDNATPPVSGSTVTFDGTDWNPLAAPLLSGSSIIFNQNFTIRANTSDGSDNLFLNLSPGGAVSSDRGGIISLGGNESGSPGIVFIESGNVGSSQIFFNGKDALSKISFNIEDVEKVYIDNSLIDISVIALFRSGVQFQSTVEFNSGINLLGINDALLTVSDDAGPTTYFNVDTNPDPNPEDAGVYIKNLKLTDLTASRPLKLDSNGIATSGQINLASTNDVTGTLPVANGGTGLTSVFGTCTPTLTNSSNVASSSLQGCFYSRVGNVVHMGLTVNVDPTAAGGTTTVYATLPVATNFSNFAELVGTCNPNGSNQERPGAVYADNSSGSRARIDFVAENINNHTRHCVIMYRVI